MAGHRIRIVVATFVAIGALSFAAPAGGGEGPSRQPDGMMRRPSVGDAWIGKNVFNTPADVWESTQNLEVTAAGRHKFEFRVKNAGHVTDTLQIRAHLWSTTGPCTFKIKRNGRDITTRMTTSGITSSPLAPGRKTDVIDLVITAGPGATNCSIEMQVNSTVLFLASDDLVATVADTT